MYNFNICIPSKGRGGLITSHKIFKSAKLYVPESEKHAYYIYPNQVVGVPNKIKGITATRNFILSDNNGKDVFFIDDDLLYGGYVERSKLKYKVKKITNEKIYLDEIKNLFEVMYQINMYVGGFFTVGNNLTNYSWKPYLFNGVCLGSCMAIRNSGKYKFDETYKVKEDYELSLRHILKEGGTVRSNILFMQHEHTKMQGGCKDTNRIKKEKKALKRLIATYPGMIKQAKHRGTQFSIQLNL